MELFLLFGRTTAAEPGKFMALATQTHFDPAVMLATTKTAGFPTTGVSSPTAEEILDRIDSTLDLIAEANQIAAHVLPAARIDVSVIVRVCNHRDTLGDLLDRIEEVMPPATETILVDDGSTDGSAEYARHRIRAQQRQDVKQSNGPENAKSSPANPFSRMRLIARRRSHGRGSCLRLGIRHSRGHIVAIQNVDLTQDPADLLGGIWPILEDQSDAVFGARRVHPIASSLATLASNRQTGLRLTDMLHSQKVFRGDLVRSLHLTQPGDGFDREITSQIAAASRRTGLYGAVGTIMEVPMTHMLIAEDDDQPVSRWDAIRAAWRRR